ncbi:unnamed protein product [Amoebophrya sp. A120]|nr:unnamed protein product [Amoebophrya sp. A120]|eukprot:GSA120T00001500001.1
MRMPKLEEMQIDKTKSTTAMLTGRQGTCVCFFLFVTANKDGFSGLKRAGYSWDEGSSQSHRHFHQGNKPFSKLGAGHFCISIIIPRIKMLTSSAIRRTTSSRTPSAAVYNFGTRAAFGALSGAATKNPRPLTFATTAFLPPHRTRISFERTLSNVTYTRTFHRRPFASTPTIVHNGNTTAGNAEQQRTKLKDLAAAAAGSAAASARPSTCSPDPTAQNQTVSVTVSTNANALSSDGVGSNSESDVVLSSQDPKKLPGNNNGEDGHHSDTRPAAPKVVNVTSADKRKLFVSSAVPMIGFGFMDNMVMIQAGDLIDNTIGVHLGLATLTAAACGQVFSDVSGVCFGGVVDNLCAKLGLPVADLTTEQRQLPDAKRCVTFGSVCGVIVGCCLGMTSLLFMDLDAADRAKKQQELDTIFRTVIVEGSETLGAERCSLFVVDHEKQELWTRAATGVKEIIKVPVDKSLVGTAVLEADVVNVPDVYRHSKFNRDHDDKTGFRTRNILCVPVFQHSPSTSSCSAVETSSEGTTTSSSSTSSATTGKKPAVALSDPSENVVAVVQLVNSERKSGFADAEVRAAKMLARHVGIFLEQVESARGD